MREPEQFVIPALGVLVLLSVFILGTGFYSLAYPVILGVLGLAAIGTFFLPPAVQVELRIAISGLGLLTLIFMFSSLGFWLALIGFGAIGALQIRHRGVLQKSLHTVEWLKTLQLGQGGAGTVTFQAETGEATAAAQPVVSAQSGASRGGGMVNIGGIGAMVLGIIVLLSFLLPWLTFSASAGGLIGGGLSVVGEEIDHTERFSGLTLVRASTEAAGYGDDLAAFYIVPAVAGAIAVLAVLGIASIALPRIVPIIAGFAGVAIMALLLVGFIMALSEIKSSEFGRYLELGSRFGLNVDVSLGTGFWLAFLAFLLMAVLQLVVRNR